MRYLSLLLAAGFLFMGNPVSAQESEPEYEFNRHWFVSVHGGAQYTLGEASFGDLLSPTVQLGAGYQFTPWFATRLSVGAWQGKGGWNGYMLDGKAVNTTYKYNYVAPGIDFMFNLSNAICGYNPMRLFSVTAFIGGGANIGFGNDEANELANAGYDMRYVWSGTKVRPVGRGGLSFDFRVSDRVSLGIEGNANVLSDKYNSKKAGNADWYFNALASVTIRLGKTYKKKAAPAPEPVEQTIVEPVVEEKPVSEPVVEEVKDEGMKRDVFFTINSSVIRESEREKVVELSKYLNNHKNAIVEITGYADAGTGTAAINSRLSSERAEAVKKMLTEQCGVSASQIKTSYKGSEVQPFADNDMNRVSICIISN